MMVEPGGTPPGGGPTEAPGPGEPRPPVAPRRGPSTATAVGAILRKELRVELRTLESVPAMSLFSVTTFVLFHFALDRDSLDGDLASGILWVTLLFASILAINRLFVADEEQGGFDGFLLAPVDRTALLIAKFLTLLGFLVVLEVVAVPAFGLLLLEPSLGRILPRLAGILLLADLGIAAVGTLVAALAVRTRARDLLGPLLALPLLVPVVLDGARACAPLLAAGHPGAVPVRWLETLGLYDLVFGLVAYAVFDFLLED
jgi:heme exporter protein B